MWTGHELLIWGGRSENSDEAPDLDTGLRVTPETGEVRALSQAGAPTPRESAFAVWTGSQMLIWGGREATPNGNGRAAVGGAAYDPITDEWRPIHDPRAEQVADEAVAWTGSELFVWGGANPAAQARDGFLYDPASDTTRRVGEPIAEAAAVHADAVAVEGTVVITGGYTNFPDARPVRYVVGTDSWEAVATPSPVTGSDGIAAPVFGYAGRAYFCSRDRLLCGVYAAASDSWDALDVRSGLGQFTEWPAWTLTQHDLVLFGSADEAGARVIATSYDLDTAEWAELPTDGAPRPLRGRSATWTGSGLLFWGGAAAPGDADVPEAGWFLKLQ